MASSSHTTRGHTHIRIDEVVELASGAGEGVVEALDARGIRAAVSLLILEPHSLPRGQGQGEGLGCCCLATPPEPLDVLPALSVRLHIHIQSHDIYETCHENEKPVPQA